MKKRIKISSLSDVRHALQNNHAIEQFILSTEFYAYYRSICGPYVNSDNLNTLEGIPFIVSDTDTGDLDLCPICTLPVYDHTPIYSVTGSHWDCHQRQTDALSSALADITLATAKLRAAFPSGDDHAR